MNKFKSIMAKLHTQNRDCLHWLYTDKQVYISSLRGNEQPIEEEKVFYYRMISFGFIGTGLRTPEKLVLLVWIPEKLCSAGNPGRAYQTAYEDYLLRLLSAPVNALSRSFQNNRKDSREKPVFSLQPVNSVVQRRNGCIYMQEKNAFRLRISFQVPLFNGASINGKSCLKGVRTLLDMICEYLKELDREALDRHIRVYARQLAIREFIREQGLLAFIADGSILPRQGDSEAPMRGAVPFVSPAGLKVTVPLPDGGEITGMGLAQGITIITGGGYSGKSTLLDSLAQGIYHHIEGDGREYLITDASACRIYAEDGRYVPPVDISPFFSYVPGNGNIHDFSTTHASGSVSQAVNIIEAVYGGSRLLLIDEDTSATNFMIRDQMMRKLVKKEAIIPYTDRVQELKRMGVSTVLVIGGSGEYLKYADSVLLMEDYVLSDRTEEVRGFAGKMAVVPEDGHRWMKKAELPFVIRSGVSPYIECVRIEHAHYIVIDHFVSDITRLTALNSKEQLNSLAWMMERLLVESGRESMDLRERCQEAADRLFPEAQNIVLSANVHQYELCLAQVRGIDLLMAMRRLRGTDI